MTVHISSLSSERKVNMLNEIYAYRRKAFYYETDKMGIVHHSNYIRWFEESRVSLLEQAGLPFEAIEAQGVMVPVLSAECHYKFPVGFDEEFAVIPKIENFNGLRFEITYKIVSPDNTVLYAEGKTAHCFVNMNMKPIRTQKKYPEIYDVFNRYVGYEVKL